MRCLSLYVPSKTKGMRHAGHVSGQMCLLFLFILFVFFILFAFTRTIIKHRTWEIRSCLVACSGYPYLAGSEWLPCKCLTMGSSLICYWMTWMTVAYSSEKLPSVGNYGRGGRKWRRRMHEKSPRRSWSTRRSCRMWRRERCPTPVFGWNSSNREERLSLFEVWWSSVYEVAPPKFNMEPKNEGLQDVFPLQMEDVQVPC